MSDVEIVVGIRGDDSGGRVIKRSLDDINSSSKQAANSNQRLEQQVKATTLAANGLARAFAAIGISMGIREIIKAADQYTVMEARLKSIAKTTQETSRMMGELRKISNQTGSEMETSLSIIQRLSFVREEIKATNNDMLAFTETVTKLGVTSGALPEAMKAGLTQLGQALSSQYTRAEEFNSIMENIPAVGKAIADQLGVSTGQMRLLVVEGKLLSSDVFAALLNQTEKVRAEFEEFPKTATQGLKQMMNALDQVIAQANSATGATNGIGMALRGVGEAAKVIYNGLGTAFDYLVAGIQEGVNLITIAINKAIEGVNYVKQHMPFADKTPIEQFSTVGVGSVFSAANAARKGREKSLFGDDFDSSITPEQRAISQDYAKIAAGLGGDNKAKKAAETAAKKAAREAAAEAKRQQNELTSAINGSRTEQEKLNDEIAHLEKLKGVAKTREEIELLNRGIRNTQSELDKVRLKVELDSPMAKAFKAIADEVQDGFKDAFKGAFDGGGSLFKKMADGIKATFKSLLLDLAYQAAVRPIVISILGGIGGSMGLSGSAVASTLGTTGGGASGIGSLGSIFSMGKSILSGGVGTGLGNFAGKASSFLGGSFSQNLAVQKFFTNAGSFGNIAGGALGGIGANLLGLGNKNGYVNAATGTIGGLLGSAGGPIGSAIGSFLGTALGGLFGGGKKSDMAQGGTLDFSNGITTVNGQTGKKYSEANATFRNQVFEETNNILNLLKSYGATVQGSINLVVGSRDGLRLNGQNFGNNANTVLNKIKELITSGVSGLNKTSLTILAKLGLGDMNTLSNGLAFGAQYDETLKSPADKLADAIKAVNDQFQGLIDTAKSLGLPIEEYTKALDRQKDVALGALKAQQAGFDSMESMTKTFNDFLNGQALGSNSSLNPMDKLKLAQGNFGDLLTKAQGGDLSVTQDLLTSANQLIDIARNTYASGTSFAGIEKFVRSSVEGVGTQAGVTGLSSQDVIANNVIQSNQVLVETNKAMQEEIIKMRKVMESLRNQLAVAA